MARRKKSNTFKRFVIITVVIIAIELVWMVFFQTSKTVTVKDAIHKAVDAEAGMDARRKEIIKIQLAIKDFQARNELKLPATLDELRPTYFDVVPNDPVTGKPFSYKVENNVAMVAYDLIDQEPKSGGAGRGKADDAAPNVEAALALLNQADEAALISAAAYTYDSTGKRDPFRPFDFTPRRADGANVTQLEQYDIGQLKLTAVLGGKNPGDATAIVENEAGRGFTVRKGTKIGLSSGEVVEILPDKLLILETITDFTGQKKTQTVEMKLRTADQSIDPQSSGGMSRTGRSPRR